MTLMRHLNTRTRPTRRWALDAGDEMGDLFDRMERMMLQPFGPNRVPTGSDPYPIDLYETNDSVVLEMAVPGLRPDQLDISLEGRQLTIHGVLPDGEEEQSGSERSYWLRGIPRGEFQRTVTVPAGVDADQIDASVDEGLLTLTMPKAAEAKARKIDVRQGKAALRAP